MKENERAMMESSKQLKETPSAPAVGAPESAPLTPEVPDILSAEPEKKTKGRKKQSILDKVGTIAIKPFLEGGRENMGLEDYDMVVFPGTHQEEQIAAIERNGVVRYITGLDEFSAEVQNITDDAKKEAVIKNIRLIVADLEKRLATNVISVDDPEFWNKVKLLKPDNHDFWHQISIRCGNEAVWLKPKEDPYDLIKLMAIEAGGFDLVAKSYEDAQTKARPPKWYLDKEKETVSTRTEYKKLRNKAIGELDSLYNKNPKKLLYVTKTVDVNSARYKTSTPPDTLYEIMDEYIAGNGVETNKSRAAQHFLDTAKLDMETLKLKSLVKDASFYKFISIKSDGMLYHSKSSTMLGRNVTDVVEYLKSPLNEDILAKLMDEVEQFWN